MPSPTRVASTKLYLALAREVNQSSWAGPRAFMHSFDQRVGARDERRRNLEAERLRGFQIDDQFEPGRLQHRQIGWARLLEHECRIRPLLAIQIGKMRAIAHQAARRGEIAPFVDRGDAIARGERNDLVAPGIEERIAGDEERTRPPLLEPGKRPVDLAFVGGRRDGEVLHHAARNRASRCRSSARVSMVTPLKFPPGRWKPATRPRRTGSPSIRKMIGVVAVAALAAITAGSPLAAMTATLRSRSSAASAGS